VCAESICRQTLYPCWESILVMCVIGDKKTRFGIIVFDGFV